ncbi:hypothetical protein [Acidocella facilis]|uniref:hypothetical protein n=1 Tax=Acidocella facilis TaxID=525 RepID=UPI00047BB714|nr:hypothetical protein [Acidocella facilis]
MATLADLDEAKRIQAERQRIERDRVQLELRANATPETLRHKSANVVDTLFIDGRITGEQRRAAHEIATVFQVITSASGVRLMSWQQRARGNETSTDAMVRVIGAYRRYSAWRGDASATRQIRTTGVVADLIFDLVVSNLGLHQAARAWGMDQRRVLALVREALYRYAEMSDWFETKPGAPQE